MPAGHTVLRFVDCVYPRVSCVNFHIDNESNRAYSSYRFFLPTYRIHASTPRVARGDKFHGNTMVLRDVQSLILRQTHVSWSFKNFVFVSIQGLSNNPFIMFVAVLMQYASNNFMELLIRRSWIRKRGILYDAGSTRIDEIRWHSMFGFDVVKGKL